MLPNCDITNVSMFGYKELSHVLMWDCEKKLTKNKKTK